MPAFVYYGFKLGHYPRFSPISCDPVATAPGTDLILKVRHYPGKGRLDTPLKWLLSYAVFQISFP